MSNIPTIDAYFVGAGRISQKHYNVVQKLSGSGINLVGVCDLNLTKARDLVKHSDIVIEKDYRASDAFNRCNLGVVLTESGSHFEHAKYILESGMDVLVEKPVTLTLSDAYELEKISQAVGRKIYVVKQNRFNPPVAKARELFDNNRLGELSIGTTRVRWSRPQSYYDQASWRGTWKHDGGVIANQASHHIDLLQWFMGPVDSVTAYSQCFGVNIETEDTIVAIVKFKSGALGTIEATTCVRPRNLEGSLSLIGSKGSVEIGGFAVNEVSHIELEDMTKESNLWRSQDTSDVYGGGHLDVYKEIIKDKMGMPNKSVDVSESIKSLSLIHMIYKSVECGRTIIADELGSGSMKLGVGNENH